MKTKALSTSFVAILLAQSLVCDTASAQEGSAFVLPPETEKDLDSGFVRKYEDIMREYRRVSRRFFKFDLDTDTNRDGLINEDDGGWLEDTPPGLVLAKGSTQRVLLRVGASYPYFPGKAILSLEVCGINRANEKGDFASFDEEMRLAGRIIVWSDAKKTKKLLDSSDPQQRIYRWAMDPGYIVPGRTGVPGSVYVEATGVSGQYPGDIRLLSTIAPAPTPDGKEPEFKFLPSWDHLLITVVPK